MEANPHTSTSPAEGATHLCASGRRPPVAKDGFSSKPFRQAFSVTFEYPVVFTRDLFSPRNPVLKNTLERLSEDRRHRARVYIDDQVAAMQPGLAQKVEGYFETHGDALELITAPEVFPGGEAAKGGLDLAIDTLRDSLRRGVCRQSYIIAIGGGAMLDSVGLAASLLHRGVRLVRVPTTVLAQNDAGVGVKNGINLDGVKNAIGVFAPPFAVLNDRDFLTTLPEREWVGGIAEAFKVAIIKDAAFFRFLCGAAPGLRDRNEDLMAELVRRCAELHLDHIRSNGDPFEFGRARPLDFGHWSAHKLEILSNYRIGHGHAVAMGLALDARYAADRGWLAEQEFESIYEGLKASGFPLWYPENEWLDPAGKLQLLKGLEDFREHLGGELTLTFPQGIGNRFEVDSVDHTGIEQALVYLKDRAATL